MFLFYKIYLQKESSNSLKFMFLGILSWFTLSIFLGDFIEFIFIILCIIYYIGINKDIKVLNLILIFFIIIKFININSSYIVIYIDKFLALSNDYTVFLQILIILLQVLIFLKIFEKYNISKYIYSFLSLSLTLLLLYIYLSIFFITYIFKEIYYFERFIDLLLFFTITQGIFITFLIFYETRVQKEQELKKMNELKFENLFFYSKLIEEKNLEIEKFNHDLNNIIISINEVEENEKVKNFKKELLYLSNYTKNIPFSRNKFDTNYLKNIKNLYLKNLFLSKIEVIMNKNIKLHFECLQQVEEIKKVHNLDLVRIIGILIDNAIEETEKLNNGFINIYIYSSNGYLEFIIENNFMNKEKISIHKLMELGFSTKNNHKGLGLTIIENIVEKNKYINVNYEINDNDTTFKVILVININL